MDNYPMNNKYNNRKIYIVLISVCAALIVIVLLAILSKPSGNKKESNLNNSSGLIQNNDGKNTTSFNILMNKTTLNIGETTYAKANFNSGNVQDINWTVDGQAISVDSSGMVTGIQMGSSTLCAVLASNSSVKYCIEIKVSNTKSDFKTKLISDYGYREVSTNRYSKNNYTIDLNNKTFTYYESNNNQYLVTYHFGQNTNYVDGVAKSSEYQAILYYNVITSESTCEASPAAAEEYICNSIKENFVKNAQDMVKILKSYLDPDLTLSDIS